MVKKIIKANGEQPYSKAILHDDKYTMEVSGQVGLNPETGKLFEGIEKQTIATLDNLKSILAVTGWNFDNIIKVRIYLADINDYSKVNEIYKKYFSGDFPARVALAVKDLPFGALVEIECTAAGDEIK